MNHRLDVPNLDDRSDVNHPEHCEFFVRLGANHGAVTLADCGGDGHYLCRSCLRHKTEAADD